jgi:hypothetical protein
VYEGLADRHPVRESGCASVDSKIVASLDREQDPGGTCQNATDSCRGRVENPANGAMTTKGAKPTHEQRSNADAAAIFAV